MNCPHCQQLTLTMDSSPYLYCEPCHVNIAFTSENIPYFSIFYFGFRADAQMRERAFYWFRSQQLAIMYQQKALVTITSPIPSREEVNALFHKVCNNKAFL